MRRNARFAFQYNPTDIKTVRVLSEVKVSRDTVSPDVQSSAVMHTAVICGEIEVVDDHRIVILFTHDGESERRVFFQSQITAEGRKPIVGDRVVGRTQLNLMPNLDEDKVRVEMSNLDREATLFADEMGSATQPPITPETQQVANQKRNEK